MVMRAAFYKAVHSGLPGLYNRLVRAWERGEYSHVELVFSDGMAASSSLMDGGVRFSRIEFDPLRWDLIDLPGFDEQCALRWFREHEGARYDLLGQFRFVISPFRPDENAYWCSEAVAEALQFLEPWRYGPNSLRAVLASPSINPASAGFSFLRTLNG